ncbi:TetR/AcrR family transcriptional regulator [Polaromonas eurypsychrophila]|uniref:TetR family transcriptional regulator n=1 Tax=Polaromonas eurypsychrophila TaxID=1614635 RepID=A0A916SFJ8_9BURK|nr:TetR/AcrR family transcriptional regulator [Polaromonas eurypsychrophila]GGA97736.1 TetR family transcriptional regulator [Polaromonas eurypsychrophila]
MRTKPDPSAPAQIKTSDALPAPARRRLSGKERERTIVEEAVKFFAEVGFDGDTRELARRLNVTQPLLFKYFPNKASLVERVYQEVYVGRWNSYWEEIIADRRIPLQERLTRLYCDYAKTALTWDWVRLFMFSGLRGEAINQRYLSFLRSRILEPVAIEMRAELGLPGPDVVPLDLQEIELVWGINARVFYYGQRRWIFNVPLESSVEELVQLTIEHFIAGARAVVPRIIQAHAGAKPSPPG